MQLGYAAQGIPEDEVVVDGQEVASKILGGNMAQRYGDGRIQTSPTRGKPSQSSSSNSGHIPRNSWPVIKHIR
jgi:hypothetical protein